MIELRNKAKELLQNKTVDLVIGYEEGTGGIARPAFISDSDKADRLIYDNRCHHNLAVYLKKKEIKRVGKIAVVASLPIMKSLIILSSENQVKLNEVVVLGIDNDNKLVEFADVAAIEKYFNNNPEVYRAGDKELLDKINAMTAQERWEYWQKEFSKCIKCYACRASCPMCYCTTCTVDCNKPQWISVPSHDMGNLEWHLMRAMHLAGRCSNCGQCAEACPVGIPVNILSLKLSEDIAKEFNFRAGTSAKQDYVLSTFKTDDKENFIG